MYFKGIVMGVKKKYALVMIESGEIVRINLKEGLNIGDNIFFLKEDIYNEKNISDKPKNMKWFIPVVLVAVITILVITPLMKSMNNNVYAVLTIDINPSIELKVNKDKEIIEVNGLNYDSTKLNIDELKGLNIDEGTILLKEMILDNDNILNKDCIVVGFTLLNHINDGEFKEDVQDIIENNFEDFNIVYSNSREKELNNAKLKGISLGRYTINEKLKDKISEESLRDVNIPKLIELFKDYLNKTDKICEIEILDNIRSKLEDDIDEKEEQEEEKEQLKDTVKDDVKYNENIKEKNNTNSNLEINDKNNKDKIQVNDMEEKNMDLSTEYEIENTIDNNENDCLKHNDIEDDDRDYEVNERDNDIEDDIDDD